MASAAALRTLLTRLQFTNEAAASIVNEQMMRDLAQFALLTDDEVTNLCKVTRRPGGLLPNPNANAPGQPPMITNPGVSVSLVAENNLKLACYWLRFKERTSRVVTPEMVTLDSIQTMRRFKLWEEQHRDVDPPEINVRDWPRTIEAIQEYLRGCLGDSKLPLAYVIRKHEEVPETDPEGGYATYVDELVARAPIKNADGTCTATYLTDRVKVWELISTLTRGLACFTHVRPAQRTHDGRMAFFGLRNYYLGMNNVNSMSAQAERVLQLTKYTGESKRFNFDSYVKRHVDQHHILDGLVEHGYSGIDNRSKVRHLIDGIDCSPLDNVKLQIMSDPKLLVDFDASVNLFKDFLKQVNSGKRDVTVAAAKTKETGKNVKSGKHVEPDLTVADRYYSQPEYAKLTPAQKAGLREKRKLRNGVQLALGRKRAATKTVGGGFTKRDINSIVASAVHFANPDRFPAAPDPAKFKPYDSDGNDGDESDESSGQEKPKPALKKKPKYTNNRNNPSLKRK